MNISINFLMMWNKKYFAFSYGGEQEKVILISFNFNCIHVKGWLVWSCQELSWLLETRNILLFLMVTNKKKVSTLLTCSEGKTAPGRPRRAHLLYPIHFTQMAQSPINIGWPDSMECQSKYSGWVYVCQKRYCLAKIDCLIKYQKRL